MSTPAPSSDERSAAPLRHQPGAVAITTARTAASSEMSHRVRQYTLAMAFRMACFISMVFVGGWVRWALLAVAVFMPYLAVVIANQADQRSAPDFEHAVPDAAPALLAGPAPEVVAPEGFDPGAFGWDDSTIPGEVVEDPDPVRRA